MKWLGYAGNDSWCAALLTLALVGGCEALTPDAPEASALLDGPIEGLSGTQRAVFLSGDETFGRRFGFTEGLGPLFNAASCDACHPGDGRAHPEFGFTRFGRASAGGFDPMYEAGGPQLQDRAAPGYEPEALPEGVTGVTVMLAPPVTGLGLLESVDDATLLALADPDDADGDGVSGRVRWVAATPALRELAALADDGGGRRMIEHDGRFIGRFGRKASNINLVQQTVMAFHQDMGLTSDFALLDLSNPTLGSGGGDGAVDPEVASSALFEVAFYLRALRPPARRDANAAHVVAGERHFEAVGCAACHVPSLPTGASRVAPLAHAEARAYTDLLLHDMGSELNDGYIEGEAAAGEWRTPPLWGLGLAADFQGGRLFLLHDGRARTLREAIALHGGEAAGSRERFRELDAQGQAQLLRFLESL